MTYYMFRDVQGLWRWNLQSPNNRKIADSAESYYNKQDCLAGINLVKGSSQAPVKEVQ